MKYSLYTLIALLGIATLQGQLQISFNYEMVEGIGDLKEEKIISDIRFKQLMSAKGTLGLIKKMQTYRPEVDADAFRGSLSQLLGDSTGTDPFFYSRVKNKFNTAAAFVANVKNQELQVTEDLSSSLTTIFPDSETRQITVYFVFGAIGGGWTMEDEPDSFYVDASSFEKEDVIGLQYLCKHEILHLIQDRTRPKIGRDTPVAYYLEQAFREGMATYLADFSTIENAKGYALFNQRIYRKNERRISRNYGLFELLVIDLFEGRCDYDFVDALSLSGMYDSPAYFVFYDMIRTLESRFGKAEIHHYFELGAVAFIEAYQRLAETEHHFSKRFEEVLAVLD